jgi:outer membrane protein assembly factor BamB
MYRLFRAFKARGVMLLCMLLAMACQQMKSSKEAQHAAVDPAASGCFMPFVRPERDGFYPGGIGEKTAHVVGGKLVLLTMEGDTTFSSGVLALNGSTGKELWRHKMPPGMWLSKPVLVNDDKVHLLASRRTRDADRAGAMTVLDARNGKLLREYDLPGFPSGAVSDGRVLFLRTAGGVIACGIETGQEQWHAAVPPMGPDPLCLGHNALLIHTLNDDVIAFSKADGKELWRLQGRNTRQLMPTQSGVVLLQAKTRKKHMSRVCSLVDEMTGKCQWTTELPMPIRPLAEAPVALHDEVLCVMSIGVPSDDVSNTFSNMVAIVGLSIETGNVVWDHIEPERWKVPSLGMLSVMGTDHKFVLTTDTGIRALDAMTGKQLWAARPIDRKGLAFSTVAGAMQHLYLVAVHPNFSNHYGIVCLGAKDGGFLWKQSISVKGVQLDREIIYVAG